MKPIVNAKKKIIYCVEDDSTLLSVYAMSLSSEQYNVTLFTNGTVCLECMKVVFPDLIFLDLSLPDIDGFEFLEAVGRLFPETRVPVVIISGNSNLQAVKRAKDFNVTAYLIKPLDPAKIASFALDFFVLHGDPTPNVSAEFSDCVRRQEEIFLLDFEKFVKIGHPEPFDNFFEKASKTGLIINLGKLGSDFISNIHNFNLLHQIYKKRNSQKKVKVLSENSGVLQFLDNLGKFLKTDLFQNRNAAILNIRIGVEFNLEE